MNLSFLYPRFQMYTWYNIPYLDWYKDYAYARVICGACAPKPEFAIWPPKTPASEPNYTQVELVRDIIVVKTDRNITKTNALVGACSNCNIVLWATENLNWVLHLNPAQLQAVAYNLLGADPCSAASSAYSTGIRGVTSDTAVYVMAARDSKSM